jgi:hypothetical protein
MAPASEAGRDSFLQKPSFKVALKQQFFGFS